MLFFSAEKEEEGKEREENVNHPGRLEESHAAAVGRVATAHIDVGKPRIIGFNHCPTAFYEHEKVITVASCL